MSNKFILCTVLSVLIGVFSCSRELDVPSQLSGTVSFSFKLPNESSNARKLVDDFNLVVSAQITIIKGDGSATEITGKVMDVYESEGTFYVEEITLPVGKYQLTEFLLLDAEETALFAIPEKGKLQDFIDAQLPIAFEVMDLNKVKEIILDVLSTLGYSPEDFGLDPEKVKFRPLLYFWVALRDKYDEEKYLLGDLVINTSYQIEVDSAAKVILKEGYEEGSILGLEAFVDGYSKMRTLISIDSLLKHQEEPLLIKMAKIQEEEKVYNGNVLLRNQEEVDEFGKYQYETIRGNLIIEEDGREGSTSIQSLSQLKGLGMVEGDFIVKNNPSLESFEGMNVNEVSGEFLIENNPKILELSGLHEFRIMGGTLKILENSSLVDYCAISKLIFEDPEVEIEVQNNGYNPTKEEIRNNLTCAAD
ncbi:hypothetical protein [Echinicola shivajiensis]|uniref:hypothetical protein n=1 Tax=Echinicola shivajiensis TaxID=1035916 RepID=UPI001BFC0B60|nr:hypothetical protein [Echinicola shivajiensis]